MLIPKPIPRANLCAKTMLLYIEVGNLHDWGLRISIFSIISIVITVLNKYFQFKNIFDETKKLD